MLENIKKWYRALPDKKRYIEFITALLTIPVLVTVLISNVGRIQEDKKPKETSPSPASNEKIIIITQKEDKEKPEEPTPTSSVSLTPTQTPKECKKEVGPVKITNPEEEQVVDKEPVCVDINYTIGDYCAVAWSHKLDNNNWSDYSSSPFCFSNLSPGKHELDLRIQSVVSKDELILERTFYYKTKEVPTPTTYP